MMTRRYDDPDDDKPVAERQAEARRTARGEWTPPDIALAHIAKIRAQLRHEPDPDT